jgi:hypothetical protein
MTQSCGAALHHAQVAAAALGRKPDVMRFPDPGDPDLLAVLELHATAPSPEDLDLLAALEARRTDRRRFTSWPVPNERLDHLAKVADGWGARVMPLTSPSQRFRAELLIVRAIEAQEKDSQVSAEQQRWVEHSPVDGLPQSALPRQQHPSERPDRFDRDGHDRRVSRPVEASDGLLAICTTGDDPADWLASGEALSALWLRATMAGLSVVPLSQVIEVEETRLALHHGLFHGMAVPQMLVRIGWQEISRSALPRTPRRPLDDVLSE